MRGKPTPRDLQKIAIFQEELKRKGRLIKEGHTNDCADLQVWGSKECSCPHRHHADILAAVIIMGVALIALLYVHLGFGDQREAAQEVWKAWALKHEVDTFQADCWEDEASLGYVCQAKVSGVLKEIHCTHVRCRID